VTTLLEKAFGDDAEEKAASCTLHARRLIFAARSGPAGGGEDDDDDGDAAGGGGGGGGGGGADASASNDPLRRWSFLKQPERELHPWLDARATALLAGPADVLNRALELAESAPQPPRAKHKDVIDMANKALIEYRSPGRASGQHKTHRVLCKAGLAVAAILDDQTMHADALRHVTHDACARRNGAKAVDVCSLCTAYHAIAARFERLADISGGEPLEKASLFTIESSRPKMLVADELGVGAMVSGAKRARANDETDGGGGAPLLSRERHRNVEPRRYSEGEVAMAICELRAEGHLECPTCFRPLPDINDPDFALHIDAGQPCETRPDCSCNGRKYGGRRGRSRRR